MNKLLLFAGAVVCVAIGYLIGVRTANWPREGEVRLEVSVPDDVVSISEHADVIRVTSPAPHEAVSSPLTVRGEARGTWYFEATFPVVVVNWDGLIVGEGYAQALDEWMTEDFVPFEAVIEFDAQQVYPRGALILHKANASGLPEHDDALEIPIELAK